MSEYNNRKLKLQNHKLIPEKLVFTQRYEVYVSLLIGAIYSNTIRTI